MLRHLNHRVCKGCMKHENINPFSKFMRLKVFLMMRLPNGKITAVLDEELYCIGERGEAIEDMSNQDEAF